MKAGKKSASKATGEGPLEGVEGADLPADDGPAAAGIKPASAAKSRTKRARSAPEQSEAAAAAFAAASTTDAAESERAAERRRELSALKAELAEQESSDPVVRWLNTTQKSEVRDFVSSRSAQMKQREYQLSLIKDFVADPSRFGIDPGDIPTSTSLEEFATRRGELQYLINTVRTFLELLTDEMHALDLAEGHARKEQDEGEA